MNEIMTQSVVVSNVVMTKSTMVGRYDDVARPTEEDAAVSTIPRRGQTAATVWVMGGRAHVLLAVNMPMSCWNFQVSLASIHS